MKKKYSISGIDCANCAAKLEAKMNELPEVDSVTLTFATGQLAVEAEDHETALEKLRELAEKMEPGTVIEEIKRGRREHKHEHHHHGHGHNHAEGESCGCGGHHQRSESAQGFRIEMPESCQHPAPLQSLG